MDQEIASKVTFTCPCGKEHTEHFETDEFFLDNHDLVCDCHRLYGVAKPPIYNTYDETEIRVVFHCKECGTLVNAYFHEDPDDHEYSELYQVECADCEIWYEVKLPTLPTVMISSNKS